MKLYPSLRNKLLISLAVILFGNQVNASTIDFQKFKDLNNDKIEESIYIKPTLEDEDRNGQHDFFLMVRYGLENGFDKPKILQRFSSKPIAIEFDDITGDGYLDLVYAIPSYGKLINGQIYSNTIMMRPNNGNGTFGDEELVGGFK